MLESARSEAVACHCCVGGRLLRRAAGDRGTARAVRGVVGTAGGRGAGCSGDSRGTEEGAPRAAPTVCTLCARPPPQPMAQDVSGLAASLQLDASTTAPRSHSSLGRGRKSPGVYRPPRPSKGTSGRAAEVWQRPVVAALRGHRYPVQSQSSPHANLPPQLCLLALNPTLRRSPPCNRRRTARGRPSHRRCGRRQRWRRRCLSLGWPPTCQTILRRPMHPRPAHPGQAAAVSPGSAQQTGDSR